MTTRPCPEAGCPGTMEFGTNGFGAVSGRCVCCERRRAFKLSAVPEVKRVACVICRGQFTVSARGAGVAKHCPACREQVKLKHSAEWRERMKQDKRRRREERAS